MRPQNYKILLNQLVSVNAKDQVMGSIPKWDAHLNTYITQQQALPHRAFSIFLFDKQNQLLFQRRSAEKKTFPLCWTNTCCSHPNMIQYQKTGKKGVEDIRLSLHRALDRQLKMDLKSQKFYLIDKILYKAQGRENQQFGQYQLDYVYLCKSNLPVQFQMVPEEVCETEWVSRNNLDEFVDKKQRQQGCYFSPWFMKMYKSGLIGRWWQMAIKNELKNAGTQESLKITCL